MAPDLLSTIRHEIEERLNELRPLLAEQEQLLVAAEALVRAHLGEGDAEETVAGDSATQGSASGRRPVKRSRRSTAAPKSGRAVRGAAREAILGALEHGSHTVAELVVVTAMSGPNINGNLRRLQDEGVVVKAEREGKAAWALAGVVV
jgi:hypothetical protein